MKIKTLLLIILIIPLWQSCSFFENDNATEPRQLISSEAVFILETNNYIHLWETYNRCPLWNLTNQNPGLNHVKEQLDIFYQFIMANPDLGDKLASQKTVFAVEVSEKFKPSILMVTQTNYTVNQIKSLIEKTYPGRINFAVSEKHGHSVAKLIFKSNDKILYFAEKEGNNIIGFDEKMLSKALSAAREQSNLARSEDFQEIASTTGKYADAHLFINFRTLPGLLISGTKSHQGNLIEGMSSFAGWSALDIKAINDKLIANGFTIADTASFLHQFNKKTGAYYIENLLPGSTVAALSYAYGDGIPFYQAVTKSKQAKIIDLKLQLKKNFFTNLDGHVTLFIDVTKPTTIANHTFAVFGSDDIQHTMQGLKQMARQLSEEKIIITKNNRDFIRIKSDEFMPVLFGKAFINLKKPWFTDFQNHLYAGNSWQELASIIEKLEQNNNLTESNAFQSLKPGISNEANVMFFLNTPAAMSLAENWNHNLKDYYQTNSSFYNQIPGFVVEFGKADPYYFTSLFLPSGEDIQTTKETQWEITLDAKIVGQPQIVTDHLSKTNRIIAFDAVNNMYFIDQQGKILWKHTLSGRPMGKITEVDAFKNNKVQYLFNTEEYLYLVDVLGRDVSPFPVKLPAKASNPAAVFDYAGTKDYRILFVGNDRRIYNYDIHGKQVAGWHKHQINGEVTQPIQRLVFMHRDYIFAVADNGKIVVTNRRGQTRIEPENNFKNQPLSQFYLNRTNSKAPFITSDITGKLTYLRTNGKTSVTDFGDFTKQHIFFYAKLDKDGYFDFIYYDNHQVKAFDRFKKEILHVDLKNQVTTKPECITYDGKTALAMTSLSENRLLLLDRDGINQSIHTLAGNTPFDIGHMKRYGKQVIVVGLNDKLIKYVL